ncbi:AAA family ATPase [Micromonospora sp. WMMC241]|uniref:helix-turn-helix transcriptional regulator n=1 Tax=Micromonospora sp. WMMC241 TaxID=3015159 RepID=UPI0022B72430|nr:LuxR family transcriptional regulator [Micromonospora sp. WMMC241]MCZ7436906.1 AAA family ATPase [Micromonospora sp. WMMC241]
MGVTAVPAAAGGTAVEGGTAIDGGAVVEGGTAVDGGADDLLGRADECRRLTGLLADAVDGRGGALVLRGAAGVGKTALLDHCAAHAAGMRVLRATGVPFEAELPFSALYELVRPLLDRLDELPARQADALRTVLAIDGGSGTVNRLAAYVATLTLLTTAAERTPVLCLVDDAHWIDPASAEALLFTARRLLADRVAVVFAARDVPGFEARGVPELPVAGLAPDAAVRLAMRAGLDRRAATDLAAATAGNPLALIELPATLGEEHRHGWLPLEQPLVLADRIRTSVLAHARGLPAATWRALVVCAVAGTTGPALLAQVLAVEGLHLDVLDPAVDAGLIRLADREVTFRHPLTRAAVHSVAGPGQRRAAHRAIASVLTDADAADRRAWHLAAATTAPDERVAALLAGSAERAQRRGGVVAEARAYERSARLTPDPDLRASRLMSAARAWANAGAGRHAVALGEEALTLTSRIDLVCRVKPLLTHLAQKHGGAAAHDRAFLAEAESYAAVDPLGAAKLTSAGVNQLWARFDIAGMLPLCTRVVTLAGTAGGPPWPKGLIRLAAAQVLAGLPEGATLARECVAVCAGHADGSAAELAEVFCWLGDHDTARALLAPEVDRARASEDVFLLAYALPRLAELEWRVGRLHAAYQAATEAVRIAEQVALPVLRAEALAGLALVEALLGAESQALARVREARRVLPVEFGEVEVRLRYATAVTSVVAARWREAATELEWIRSVQRRGGLVEPGWLPVVGELAQAYARLGRPERTAELLAELGDGRVASRVVAARVAALLAPEPDLDEAFAAALARCDGADAPLERARTLFDHGQRLRRAKRRRDARVQLHAALRLFETAGAQGWARRCRAEIDATGRRAPAPDDRGVDRLTSQERQIALHVADGLTNREIATRIFLSPKTVEYHLGNVYRKLQLRSRSDLIRHLARLSSSEPG